ncbi:N-acetyltransferase, putative [Trypanosoma cruzi]|nr:N-acetyltransferase, putative [Trypanosoma cruzi]
MSSFVSVPPHLYHLATGEEITIRHVLERSVYSNERRKVRELLLSSGAHSIPGLLEVASDPSSSVIFIALKEDKYSERGFIGFVVVNTNFLAQQRVVAISWVYVLSRFRGINVGRSLLQHVEAFSRANCVDIIEAMLTDDCTKLFKRHGFRATSCPIVFKNKALQKRVVLHPVPSVPSCITSGALILRHARQESKKQWIFCVLEACGYNFGGCDLIRHIFAAEFRIEVVNEKDGRIVAILSMDSTGWIPIIACTKEYQGRGLGSFLLFFAMEWMRRQGGNSVSLSPLNKSVVHFYKRWSFRVLSKGSRKRGRCSDEHSVLIREIDPNGRYLPDGYSLEDFLSSSTPPTSSSAHQQEGEGAEKKSP